jgi:hypothetical protein
LLAIAAAFWSLVKSFELRRTHHHLRMMPHASQIISIIRILSLDLRDRTNLRNHLVEIKTGEGKSITLGLTSIILAGMGYGVDCVCYSEYLSSRDYKDFEMIFKGLGL